MVRVTVVETLMDPDVPLTVTIYDPAAPLHDSTEFAGIPTKTIGLLKEQPRPVLGEMDVDRVTKPAKPEKGVRVMLEFPIWPASSAILVGFAVSTKYGRVTCIVVEWDSVPLVPVTVTLYAPPVPLHERDDVSDTELTVVALSAHVRPVLGTIESDKVTFWLNPLKLVMETVEAALDPDGTVSADGSAVRPKSGVVLVLKIAIGSVSFTGFAVSPLDMLMQSGGVLDERHWVWKPISVPVVLAITLYIAVKSSPVAGDEVVCPLNESATS